MTPLSRFPRATACLQHGLMAALLLAAGASSLFAGDTHIWTQGEFADFEKGVLKDLSLRSDGVLTLAPRSRELADTSSAYLWSLAQDSKGNLYAGGGAGAKLFRIAPDGKSRTVAELEALEIHGIAIDKQDRVYVATSPDGKVYRVAGNGKPEVFYDPKAKYIWALAFDSKGDLLVATGDQGEIHRVTPDGKGKVFFKTDETHVRSMAVDARDNVIVGTDPGGIVLRVSPSGEGFVLYQMPKKEVTAVAVAADGAVYAAGVGNKQSAPVLPAAPVAPVPIPSPISAATSAGANANTPRPAAPAPSSFGAASGGVSGGSEVYRIEPSGNPVRIWTSAQDVVYALALDATGRLLLGTGNKGGVYRVESPAIYTALLTVPATQVTAFQTGREGRIYAATGNVGKVYEIGPGLEHEGSIESDVYDAGTFSLWGRVNFEAELNGGQVAVAVRTGNLDQPQKNWSPWSAPVTSPKGARAAAPPARFAQWKATLTADASGRSPELEWVDYAYLPKNLPPRVDVIEITPANYRFPAPTAPVTVNPSITLPPIGKRRTESSALSLDSSPSLQYAKGFIGARWAASDPNGDTMSYTVEIRGNNEAEWKLLKDKVREKYLTWDSTAFPDGQYRLRVTASDSPGNPPAEALTARLEGDPFWIDNTPPKISGLTATRNGGKLQVKWRATDAINDLDRAEYSLDGGEWTVAAPVSQLSDSLELDYELSLDASPGEHTIAVRVEDDYDNQTTEKAIVRP